MACFQTEAVGTRHPLGSRPKWRNNAITLNNIAGALSAIALVSTVDLGFIGVMFYCTQAQVVITRTRLPATFQARGSEVARRTIVVSEAGILSCGRIREHPSTCREMRDGYNILVGYSDLQEGERADSSRRFNSLSALPTIQFGFHRDP